MKWGQKTAVVVVAGVLGLVVGMPAAVLDGVLQKTGGRNVHLVETQGSVWFGRGRVEVRDAVGQAVLAQDISWRLEATSVLHGHLVFAVQAGHDGAQFPLTIGLGGIEIVDADIDLPASILGQLAPRLVPLGLTGNVALHVDKLLIDRDPGRDRTHGSLRAHWQNAGSILSNVAPLGEYTLMVTIAEDNILCELRTLHGPLQLEGDGSCGGRGRSEFIATAYVPEQQRAQLTPLLRLIAVDQGDGSFALQVK